MKDRLPAVAGAFYPSDPEELRDELRSYFENFPSVEEENKVAALIVPHAGYVFSGKVAAAAFARLNADTRFRNIFLIGASHRKYYEGVSTYPSGHYITPLGEIKVNEQITMELMNNNHFIFYDPEAEQSEHSLEVQLPFLQFHLKKSFSIVPLLIGGKNNSTCKLLAEALLPWFNRDNLFVISSDFSHYPSAGDALKQDRETAEAILTKDPERLHQCCNKALRSGIGNLGTALCGEMAVLTLLYMAQSDPNIILKEVMYQNSGDSVYGKSDRVVGYWAIAAYREEQQFTLSDSDQKELLHIARKTIDEFVRTGSVSEEKREYPDSLNLNCGAFVSIHKGGKLRGCLGHLESKQPLWQLIREMSVATVSRDFRFDPVGADELSGIEIEISVLSPLRKIDSPDEFQLGKHGIFMVAGERSGTFLPQVATKTNWTKEEFLGYCAREKAGIGWDGWKTADLYVFEAIVFHE